MTRVAVLLGLKKDYEEEVEDLVLCLVMDPRGICREIYFEEFILNWTHQVPHWEYLTNEGINFFKGTKGKKYKDDNTPR